MNRRCFDGFGTAVLILVLGWPCAAAAQPAHPAGGLPKNLVPAQFNTKTDAQGFQWEMNSQGYLRRGGNSGFEVAGHLQVNGSEFYPRSRMMTPDGNQYFLSRSNSSSSRSGGVAVTRWIKFDLKTGTVRFVDSYSNLSAAPASLNVKMMVGMRNSVGAMLSDLGRPPGGAPSAGPATPGMIAPPSTNPFGPSSGGPFASPTLGKKESGVLLVPGGGGMPSLLVYLAAARSRVKPSVQVQGSQVYFDYQITVPPQQTVSLVLGFAQQSPGGKTDARTLARHFKPFKSRGFVADLTADVRKSLLNYGGTYAGSESPAGPPLSSVINLAEHYEVERGKADVLVQDESSRLSGIVLGGDVTVRTRYGAATVPLADVAMLLGGAGVGRPMQVHLRNGEILAGPLEWKKMTLETDGGLKAPLNPAQLNVLFMHVETVDGTPPEGAVVLLGTHQGDRLAVAAKPAAALEALSAWGPIEVPLDQVDALAMVRQPQPIHRLVLTDKSRLSVILRGSDVSLGTLRFGTVKVSPASVAGAVAAKARPDPEAEPPDEAGEERVARCELLGDNVLVGKLQTPELQLMTAAGTTPLRTDLIRVMEQDEAAEGAGAFTFELADGSQLSGRIPDRVLAIQSRGRVWHVPVRHLVAFRQPEGSVEPGPGAGKAPDPFALPPEKKPAAMPPPATSVPSLKPRVKPEIKPESLPETKPEPAPAVPSPQPPPGPIPPGTHDPFAP